MLADEGQNLAELLEGPGRPLADWLSDMCARARHNGTEMLRLRHPDSRQGEMRDRYSSCRWRATRPRLAA